MGYHTELGLCDKRGVYVTRSGHLTRMSHAHRSYAQDQCDPCVWDTLYDDLQQSRRICRALNSDDWFECMCVKSQINHGTGRGERVAAHLHGSQHVCLNNRTSCRTHESRKWASSVTFGPSRNPRALNTFKREVYSGG